MTNPLLGNTLERIAGGGADEFYRGQLVQDILMDLHDHGECPALLQHGLAKEKDMKSQ